MALIKESRLSISDIRDTISDMSGKDSVWLPKLGALEQVLEESYSVIYQNEGVKELTVYYMVDGPSGVALYSQAFKSNGSAGSKTKLLSSIYFGEDSDAKIKGFYDLEQRLGLDFDGDGLIGSGLVVIQSGAKMLVASDLSPLDSGSYLSLGLGANGRVGSKLTIDTSAIDLNGSRVLIGSTSIDPVSPEAAYTDGLLSAYQVAFPGVGAGLGIAKQGIVNIQSSDLYFTGGLISSYIIKAFGIGEQAANTVLGGIGVGVGSRSSGTLNVLDSNLYFQRNIDPVDVESLDYDVLSAMLSVGDMGGTGSATIANSLMDFKGVENDISVGNALGGKGTLRVTNSQLVLDAQYSINDDPLSGGDLASSSMNVGYGKNAKGTASFENTSLIIDGCNASCDVGVEGANGSLSLSATQVQQIAKRSLEPLTRDVAPLTVEDYALTWSGSYLVIGADDSDNSARSNMTTVGTVSLANDSLYLIKGPHAGIEVGAGGTKSTGTLSISQSTVEILGSGAIQIPETASGYDADYLAAGFNSSGSLDSWYFTYMNIGGSSWQDFGGAGTVNLLNQSKLNIYSFDINSNDSVLDSSNAWLSIGGWGAKGLLNIDGGSALSISGRTSLGLTADMGATAFGKSNGLYNMSNYSIVNVKNGSLESFSYESQLATQSSNSPLAKYAMYTVLGNEGAITANQFNFQKNSQIVGSGTLLVQDVFSGNNGTVHDDMNTPSAYAFNDNASNGLLNIYETQIFVGDTLNTSSLARSSGFGTLTFKSQVDEPQDASISIGKSTIVFDLGKTASDQLVIDSFDQYSFVDDTFVINGKGAVSGSRHVLIDFQFNETSRPNIDSYPPPKLVLVGIKGSVSYDEATTDLIFTVA